MSTSNDEAVQKSMKDQLKDGNPDWGVVRTIIENDAKGIAIKVVDENQRTPIHMAVMNKTLDIDSLMKLIEFLYEKWPESLTEKSKLGSTPLHEACYFSKWTRVIMFLIEKCPDKVFLTAGYRGSLPLHEACYNEVFEEPVVVIKALIDKCEEALKIGDEDNWLPLHVCACGFATFEVLEYIHTRYPKAIDDIDINGQLPIHNATRCHADLKKIQYLYQAYPKALTIPDEQLMLPLHHICTEDKEIEITKFLVSKYSNALKERDNLGRTPLHRACYYNLERQTIEYLLWEYPQAFTLRATEKKHTPYDMLKAPNQYPTVESKKTVNTVLCDWFKENTNLIETTIIYRALLDQNEVKVF